MGLLTPPFPWRFRHRGDAKHNMKRCLVVQVTLTNVAIKSKLLWVHAIACYFVAIIVMRVSTSYLFVRVNESGCVAWYKICPQM